MQSVKEVVLQEEVQVQIQVTLDLSNWKGMSPPLGPVKQFVLIVEGTTWCLEECKFSAHQAQ